MAKLSHLLLFDTDPSGLETLTYAFEKDGIAVESVGDAAKARERLASTTASILLVALRDPELVGLDLIRATLAHPATRNLACLALGPAKSRAAALQAGAFGLLSSPLFVRDVIDSCKLIAAASLPGSRPAPETEVSISLGEIGGVYHLIRALAASARSAAVEIQRGARRGELRFLDGNLSSVQLGGLSGLSALHQLLLWEEADLRLKFRNVVRRGGHLSLKNDEVIEQCDRFLRDFAHEVREMGAARTVYRPSGHAVQPTSALPSEVVPLLRLFDGKRDLSQVLDESPFRTFDTLRIARQFMNAGAIVADPPFVAASSDAAVGGPAALDGWFGRRLPVAASGASSPPTTRSATPATARPEGARDRNEGIPTALRTPAPFVNAGSLKVAAATMRAAATTPAVPPTNPKDRKPRTVTQREPTLQRPDPTSAPLSMQSTPVAVIVAAAPPPAASERSTKPAASVATGEIHVTRLTPKRNDRPPKPSAPTVLVEIGPLPTPQPTPGPTPRPIASVVVAAPLEGRPTPTRMELPGPVTPLPIVKTSLGANASPVTASPPARTSASDQTPVRVVTSASDQTPVRVVTASPDTTPAPVLRVAPLTKASSSPPPEPVTPPPVMKATPATPGPVAKEGPTMPAPTRPTAGAAAVPPPPMTATTAAVATGPTTAKKSGVPSIHRTRTPSNGFSDVEADFFNREADLYKGDSPETFDDLDTGTGSNSPPQLASGRRRPVRKT